MGRKYSNSLRGNLCLILISSLLVFTTCESDSSKDDALKPVACFTTTSDSYSVGEEITFTNCSEKASFYLWSFGDDYTHISRLENPRYAFTESGVYEVILIVQNSEIKDVNNDLVFNDHDLTDSSDLIKKTLYITSN